MSISSSVVSSNIRSSIIVSLVSLPLSLGIAHTSGVPLFMGVLAAIIGALIVCPLSQSNISISGPSPNVIVVVAAFMVQGGTTAALGAGVFLAGVCQILLGRFKGGIIGEYFPGTVIKGMLAGIGITIVRTQISPATAHAGTMIICGASLLAIFLWSRWRFGSSIMPAGLFAVIVSVTLNYILGSFFPAFHLDSSFLVNLEFSGGLSNFFAKISFPDWSSFLSPKFYELPIIIATIVSLESILGLDAADEMDTKTDQHSSKNRELVAQGIGNSVAGLLGALPIGLAIPRTKANVDAGASIKLSSVLHGVWIFLCIIFFPKIVEMVPIASLAAILILVGFKLTPISLYRTVNSLGLTQAIPFYVTIVGVLSVNLITGVFWGLMVSIFFVMREQVGKSVNLVYRDGAYVLNFSKDISFLSKSTLKDVLSGVPENSEVIIDSVMDSSNVDRDIVVIFEEFLSSCKKKNIKVTFKRMSLSKQDFFEGTVTHKKDDFTFQLSSEDQLASLADALTDYSSANMGSDLSLVETYLDAKFCLEEVIYNIFCHGYANNSTHPSVEVLVRRDGNRVIAQVSDNANHFNPLEEIEPPDEELGIYLGFNLVRKLARELDYRKIDSGNQLTLIF